MRSVDVAEHEVHNKKLAFSSRVNDRNTASISILDDIISGGSLNVNEIYM